MIKDRGTIKWTSLMLPEHVKALRDWAVEDKLEKKPELDEQAFEQIEIVVMDSLNYTLPIHLTIWENGLYTIFSCIVAKVNLVSRQLKLELQDDMITVTLDSLVSVERV
ncbi:YolD-like family protein [Peribacillus sp. NPDC097206]|uniref:YolD-like family protein n=1 Tax=unclassified Peribacillus TaxID=2675266 RepID=UPI003809C1B9